MKNWINLIDDLYKDIESRQWTRTYWSIDLHGTIITGKYNKFNSGAEIYPYAKETLDYLYNHSIHQSILWTSSYSDAIIDILDRFNLNFNYSGENPECESTELCDFKNKFYFNMLLDDKSGFDPNNDWWEIYNTLIEIDCRNKIKKDQYEFSF